MSSSAQRAYRAVSAANVARGSRISKRQRSPLALRVALQRAKRVSRKYVFARIRLLRAGARIAAKPHAPFSRARWLPRIAAHARNQS